MNYELLLQKLNVDISPLDKKSETFKTIENLIYKGQQIDNNFTNSNEPINLDDQDDNGGVDFDINDKPYRVECIDVFNASRPSDSNKSFSNKDNFKQSLLWYGCFNSSVAAKLLNGIQPTYTAYTNYKAVSCWDNIIGCTDNINMGKFYKDPNGRYKPNKGILMLVEVNYKEKAIPNQIKIDSIKSEDYTRETLNYNEDDDTEDENDDNDEVKVVLPKASTEGEDKKKKSNGINNRSDKDKKEKYVYCKEINDEIGMNQLLQITGELSPNPNHSIHLDNIKIPNGPFIPSTKIVKGNGWLNGYLKIWDKYNQYLIPSDKMIKLRYLVVVETRPTKYYKPQKSSISPSKNAITSPNNKNKKIKTSNFTKPNNNSSIWDSVLVKRSIDKVDNNNNNNNNNKNNNTNNEGHSFIVPDNSDDDNFKDDNHKEKINKRQKI